MENLFNHLEQVVLRMDSRFCTEDGHLLKNNVIEAALALDPKLLHYLLADEKLKKTVLLGGRWVVGVRQSEVPTLCDEQAVFAGFLYGI